MPGHLVLAYRGDTVTTLEPGRHLVRTPHSARSIDMRDRLVPVAAQEVLTADAMTVRVSMSLRIRVTDPVAFVDRAEDPVASVYLAAQLALRETCASVTTDDLIRRGDTLDVEAIRSAAADVGARLGLDVLGVVIREVILPSEVRSAALELVTAKTRGLAKLEAAPRRDGVPARTRQRRSSARRPSGARAAAPRRVGPVRRTRRAQRRRRRGVAGRLSVRSPGERHTKKPRPERIPAGALPTGLS